MSVYSIKGKGYRYDFTSKRKRYTGAWFKTKREARAAEEERRRLIEQQAIAQETEQFDEMTPMGCLEVFTKRLDYLKAQKYSASYQNNCRLACMRLIAFLGGEKPADEISPKMALAFLEKRHQESGPGAANDDMRLLRATWGWAGKKGRAYVQANPFQGIERFVVGKRKQSKRVPTPEELDQVIAAAHPDGQDYLWLLRETLARSIEINRLEWSDVDLEAGVVTLWTRKSKSREPVARRIPMTKRLREVLTRLYTERDPSVPWVFWHMVDNRATKQQVQSPYVKRDKLLVSACRKAEVEPFTFHRIRAHGATMMNEHGVEVPGIQRVLGHQDRKTTEIYLGKISKLEVEAMLIFERASRDWPKSHTEAAHDGCAASAGKAANL